MNSTAIGVKKPSENLMPLSIDLRALLIANTVFFEETLWKVRSSVCKWLKALYEILWMEF